MTKKQFNRYPGTRAFNSDEYFLFFGRRNETRKLFAQVKAQNLVVLFAKSGIGKSSLINAGLIPILEDNDFKIIKIRFQDLKLSPLENTLRSIENENVLDKNKLEQFAPYYQRDAHLWEFLKACPFNDGEVNSVPILIFDQFEEFFEHPRKEREKLSIELSYLINERIPERISNQLRNIPIDQRTEEDFDWHQSINVRIIFAIRSDRISLLLDDLSDVIPNILNNHFHLKPLLRNQAKAAIEEPAAMLESKLINFATAPFEYQPQTLEKILDYLSDENGEVASFQLQLLCQHIEQQVKERSNN